MRRSQRQGFKLTNKIDTFSKESSKLCNYCASKLKKEHKVSHDEDGFFEIPRDDTKYDGSWIRSTSTQYPASHLQGVWQGVIKHKHAACHRIHTCTPKGQKNIAKNNKMYVHIHPNAKFAHGYKFLE